jgi:nicotinate-nucleotide adenylyltransferase
MTGEQKNTDAYGILGGTFDPIHLGHTEIARAAHERFNLTKVFLVPAFRNPLRLSHRIIAPADDRLEMARLATRDEPWIEVDTVELDRGRISPKPSFTIDTLIHFSNRFPDIPMTLIVGADNVAFHKWHRAAEFTRYLSRIVIVSRPEYEDEMRMTMAGVEYELPDLAAIVEFITDIDIPISSTAIRESLSRGIIPPGTLHPDVEQYIRHNSLYGISGGNSQSIE